MKSAHLLVLSFVAASLFGCAGDDDDSSNDDAAVDDDMADDDAADDDAADDDVGDDDADDDTWPPLPDDDAECVDGERACSDDALELRVCEGGAWTIVECMRDEGKLCEDGACVDPWRYGSPVYDSCADDPHATAMTLAEKAAKYDELAPRLHIHPDDKRVHDVTLDAPRTEADGTWEDVIDWHAGENDGLWTGLYIASQAFRYAVTGDEDALANLDVMMDGMEMGMAITGVPGIFTREYIPPDIVGMSCPANPSQYVPDVEKDDNRWVKVDTDGTILTYDAGAADWVRTTHVVPEEFAGWCWLDNVSQDEYAGHMLALAAILKLVDDADIHARATQLARKVAVHLMANDMAFVDWDGRVVEHGSLWPLSLLDYPGFNAVLGLSYILIGADATGDPDLGDYYENCLLQRGGPNDCLDRYLTPPSSFADWLWFTGLYFGSRDACKSNWNNFAMMWLGMFQFVWYEHDPALRALAQDIYENKMFYYEGNDRQMANQKNAGWSILYAGMKAMGPDSSGPDHDAVRDAMCGLRQFPESKTSPEIHVGEADYPTDWDCQSRFPTEYLTFDPVPVYERCPRTFLWWANPYEHQNCDANPQLVFQPADYLLPYWAARYFGFLGEDD